MMCNVDLIIVVPCPNLAGLKIGTRRGFIFGLKLQTGDVLGLRWYLESYSKETQT
jgi:hypothetical protein